MKRSTRKTKHQTFMSTDTPAAILMSDGEDYFSNWKGGKGSVKLHRGFMRWLMDYAETEGCDCAELLEKVQNNFRQVCVEFSGDDVQGVVSTFDALEYESDKCLCGHPECDRREEALKAAFRRAGFRSCSRFWVRSNWGDDADADADGDGDGDDTDCGIRRALRGMCPWLSGYEVDTLRAHFMSKEMDYCVCEGACCGNGDVRMRSDHRDGLDDGVVLDGEGKLVLIPGPRGGEDMADQTGPMDIFVSSPSRKRLRAAT